MCKGLAADGCGGMVERIIIALFLDAKVGELDNNPT